MPHIPPITPEPKTHADDAQLSANARLDIDERRPVAQAVHHLLDPEERRGTAGVAHAARAQRDVVHRGNVFDERVWEHVAGRLWG